MMDAASPQAREATPLEEFEAALDWWREAGVDASFSNEASGWLREPEAEEPVAEAPPSPSPKPVERSPVERALDTSPAATIGGPRESWPRDLAAFREWWTSEKNLCEAAPARRIAPRGAQGAKLMVLIGEPVGEDRLLAAVLRAMGLEETDTYIASALPAPTALPDWNDLAARGLDAVLRHHIALARPGRILAFGREIAPLFGIAPEDTREPGTFAVDGADIPLLLAPDLAQLARLPMRRRNFWNRWLDWTR